MPKAKPYMQIKPSEQIVAGILKEYDLIHRAFKIFPHGIENTSLFILTNKRKYVLRIYRKNRKTVKDIQQELTFMEFLRDANIPVPQVFKNKHGTYVTRYKTSTTLWSCILQEFAQGSHPKKYSLKTIEKLAATQARMHVLGKEFAKRVPAQPYWVHLREKSFSPFIKISKLKSATIKDFVVRAKKCAYALPKNLPIAYNHMDITHDNILVKNEAVTAVLDFDDACLAPTVICLGYTLWDIIYITRKVQHIFSYLAAYTKHRPLTMLERRTLKDILLFRNYVIGTMEIMFYGEKGNDVKPILKFEKMISELNSELLVSRLT